MMELLLLITEVSSSWTSTKAAEKLCSEKHHSSAAKHCKCGCSSYFTSTSKLCFNCSY